MTKKTNKKTTRKKVVEKNINKKKKQNTDDNFGSSGILILGIIGIVVLIYFGANTKIEGNKQHEALPTFEIVYGDTSLKVDSVSVVIDGLRYPSKEYALKVLQDLPQTQLTYEQRDFVINPDKYLNPWDY